MVTEMMRWVTSGGTPLAEGLLLPCSLMVWTTLMPEVTCPNSA